MCFTFIKLRHLGEQAIYRKQKSQYNVPEKESGIALTCEDESELGKIETG